MTVTRDTYCTPQECVASEVLGQPAIPQGWMNDPERSGSLLSPPVAAINALPTNLTPGLLCCSLVSFHGGPSGVSFGAAQGSGLQLQWP
jgi:hypothetical protein